MSSSPRSSDSGLALVVVCRHSWMKISSRISERRERKNESKELIKNRPESVFVCVCGNRERRYKKDYSFVIEPTELAFSAKKIGVCPDAAVGDVVILK